MMRSVSLARGVRRATSFGGAAAAAPRPLPLPPPRRRGVVALLAMLFLVLITTLSVGLYESSAIQAQVARTDQTRADVFFAAESGSEFMRFQLGEANLPYGTTPANLMANTAAALGALLNGTPVMGGNTVAVSSGTIYIPSKTAWAPLDSAGQAQFQATITQVSGTNKIVVTVRGRNKAFNLTRGVQMTYEGSTGSYALAGLNGVTLKLGAFTDSYDSRRGAYGGKNVGTKGSIVSNGNITLNNTSKVNGDARPGAGKTLTIRDTASVTGRTTPLPGSVSYPSVVQPAGLTNLGDINMSSGTQTLPGGSYLLNSLNLSGTAKIVWQGPVKLYIKTGYSVSGSADIQTYGNNPANRTLYFLPTCTTATWTGTNVCVGELYAPDTDFTIGGQVELQGRVTAKTITNSSTGGMHSDVALPGPSGSGPFTPLPNTYKEVP